MISLRMRESVSIWSRERWCTWLNVRPYKEPLFLLLFLAQSWCWNLWFLSIISVFKNWDLMRKRKLSSLMSRRCWTKPLVVCDLLYRSKRRNRLWWSPVTAPRPLHSQEWTPRTKAMRDQKTQNKPKGSFYLSISKILVNTTWRARIVNRSLEFGMVMGRSLFFPGFGIHQVRNIGKKEPDFILWTMSLYSALILVTNSSLVLLSSSARV